MKSASLPDGFFLGQIPPNWNEYVRTLSWEDAHNNRVKVRIPGKHSKGPEILDKDLPWAIVSQSTSAGNRNGTSTGLSGGEWVIGFYLDEDEQLPVIMQVLGKNEVSGAKIKASENGTTQFRDVSRFASFTAQAHQMVGGKKPPGTLTEIDEKTNVLADTIIISTGASAKWLGIDDEKRLNGYGVSACATCDGFFYKGLDVVVVGGGDTAAEEATYLAKLCTKVTLLVRRDEMRASKAMQKRVFNTDNLEVLFNHETKSINGEPGEIGVESVTALNNITGEETIIPAKGFFVAIGHTPNTSLFKDQLDMDENGYLIIEAGTSKTKIPGVFAAGDVADHVYRQAVTSAGTGCMAALDAERFLASQE
mgnify:CR=1 FL=1